MLELGRYKTVNKLDAHVLKLRETIFYDLLGNRLPTAWTYWGYVDCKTNLLCMAIWNVHGEAIGNPMNNLVFPQNIEQPSA